MNYTKIIVYRDLAIKIESAGKVLETKKLQTHPMSPEPFQDDYSPRRLQLLALLIRHKTGEDIANVGPQEPQRRDDHHCRQHQDQSVFNQSLAIS